MKKTSRVPLLILVILCGFVLRIVLAKIFYGGTNDVSAWEQYSTYWAQGKSAYDATGRYNYSPLWFWILTACSQTALLFHLPFAFVIKWPMILADALTAALLFLAARKQGFRTADCLWAAAALALNPVSIILSGYGGQFDNIATLLVFASWYLSTHSKTKNTLLAPAAFALGVAVKHFNVLLAPAFAFQQKKPGRKILFLVLPPLLFLSLFIPYWADRAYVAKEVFGYSLGAGYWGWSGILCRVFLFVTQIDLTQMPWFHGSRFFNPALYLGIFALSYFWAHKYDLLDWIIFVFLTFYVFTTQMAPQYTVWIIPFAVLRRNIFFYLYSAIGAIQLGFFYYCHYFWEKHIPMTGTGASMSKAFVIARYLTWAVCVLWWVSMVKKNDKIPAR